MTATREATMTRRSFPPLRARLPTNSAVWMTSLADMMTLLLCLFVFMFSFADLNAPKFDEFSGRMKDAFGARVGANGMPASGTDDLSFAPSPSSEWLLAEARTATPNSFDLARRDFARLRATLSPELAAGGVELLLNGGRIRVRFDTDDSAPLATRLVSAQRVARVLQKLSALDPALAVPVTIAGATPAMLALAETTGASSEVGAANVDAETSSLRLRAQSISALERAFAPEMARGLIHVHRGVDSLVVRVGEGGAFASGDATLTPFALAVIDKIGELARQQSARIVIGGHTDDQPINTSRFRDNWDLSAARAIAVVRELVTRRGIDPRRIEAQGFADTRPVAPNDSESTRALNRRIEIEVRWTGS